MNNTHYLESELASLFESDKGTWQFVQRASLDGVWYWDLENPENLWISPEYWHCLGIDPATQAHSPQAFIDVVFEDDLPKIMDNLERHYADPSVVYEQIVRFKHVDGSTVWIRCKGQATRDENGKAIRMLGAHNDITALKNAEMESKLLLKNRERFFARMSHEIRTPLHGMVGIAEVLRDSLAETSSQKQLNTMLNCGKQLEHLLNDLLTLSKIDSDKFSVAHEKVHFSDILSFIDALYRPQAESKNLDFHIDPVSEKLVVSSDPVRLTQILSNIVSNAIKFTAMGQVCINLTAQNDQLLVSVSDTGVGIEDVSAVTTAYHQELGQQNNSVEGTGLGLEIVEKLCSALGHQLSIESELAKGTVVSVSIAATSLPDIHCQNMARPETLRYDSQQDLSVLVVDDNYINREIVKEMLKNSVSAIHSANNGLEAVDLVAAKSGFDVILMDLNMPIKDGYKAAAEINAMTQLKKRPRIIALTADAFEQTKERCYSVGIHQHLSKPFGKAQLNKSILDASYNRCDFNKTGVTDTDIERLKGIIPS